MSDIQNLQAGFDPFQDEEDFTAQPANHVHIRAQQRNGRKSVTTIQGLPSELNFKKLLKAFKKQFCCNGTIVDDEELGKIIQLSGDQRKSVSMFLVKESIVAKENLKIHGF
eukprot:gb/GECH01011304.1/.p1 GENE.gb/GECH01011304.1/~~gb/GECH01011304.1/.p1  ORF type:complete len:111 (+),score=15.44 gb/GECH01011304.1/:1-333(+)